MPATPQPPSPDTGTQPAGASSSASTSKPTPKRSIRRELRGIFVLYLAIAILPILVGRCAG